MRKVDLARQYRDEYGDEMATLKLARIMYNENHLLFKDVEGARSTLRDIEGKGNKRAKVTHTHEPRPYNPYNLPESDETEYTPYRLDFKKILLIADTHVPYHSIKALTAAIDYGKNIKPDCILLDGDFFDFHGLSRFARDPKKRRFSEELDTGAEIIKLLKKEFNCPVIFKEGNHEERYKHFLWMKASELSGIEEFDLEQIIKKRAGEVEYIGSKRILKAGKLNIIHGHEFVTGISAPVNIARGLFLKGKCNAVQGHNHQTSEHTEPTMNGDIITTWSVGCTSELHPDYMPINKWNHGVMGINVFEDGTFEVENKRIYDGKIL